MARAIDADAVKRRAWDIAEAWKDQGRDYEALLLESVVEQIVDTQRTLTPPNEALTIEQLRQMDEPVWCSCKPIEGGNGYWCLCRYGKIVTPSGNIFDVDKIPHWMFYRRPPEGEGGDANHA